MEVIAVRNDDKVAITGSYQGRLMLFIIELQEGDYICGKAVNLGKENKSVIHSILNHEDSVYMTDSYNNKIYRYNYILNELSEVTVGRDPRHMCIEGDRMFVANFESDNVSVIDLPNFTLIESIPAGIKPHDVLYSKDNGRIYVCCYEENEIIEYSVNREFNRRFTTDGKPMHMAASENSIILMAYFVNGNVHTKINFINTDSGKIEKVILIEGMSSDFDMDYKRNMLYVINIVDKKLYIISTTKKEIVKFIFLGGYPEDLTVGENHVYVTSSKKNQIISIDSNSLKISQIINLGFSPNCIKAINKD